MMKKRMRFLLLLVVSAGCGVMALAFEPLFFMMEVEGKCKILPPQGGKTVDGERARAYPYGSSIKTSSDGEVTFYIAKEHEITVSTNTIVTVADGPEGSVNWKVLKLDKGVITLQLPENYAESGRRITIETASSIAEPVTKGKYTLKVQANQDLKWSRYHTSNGEMKIYDNHLFEIPAIAGNDRVSIGISKDKNYINLRNIKGKMLVDMKGATDEEGNPVTVETVPGSMLKMWRSQVGSGNLWAATAFVVTPEGTLTNSLSYTVRSNN